MRVQEQQSTVGKKMVVNLTQPIKQKKARFHNSFCFCTEDIEQPSCEDFITFPQLHFMSILGFGAIRTIVYQSPSFFLQRINGLQSFVP